MCIISSLLYIFRHNPSSHTHPPPIKQRRPPPLPPPPSSPPQTLQAQPTQSRPLLTRMPLLPHPLQRRLEEASGYDVCELWDSFLFYPCECSWAGGRGQGQEWGGGVSEVGVCVCVWLICMNIYICMHSQDRAVVFPGGLHGVFLLVNFSLLSSHIHTSTYIKTHTHTQTQIYQTNACRGAVKPFDGEKDQQALSQMRGSD